MLILNYIVNELQKRARIINGKVKIDETQIEEDSRKEGNLRTAKVIQQLANSICGFIKVEIDYLCQF